MRNDTNDLIRCYDRKYSRSGFYSYNFIYRRVAEAMIAKALLRKGDLCPTSVAGRDFYRPFCSSWTQAKGIDLSPVGIDAGKKGVDARPQYLIPPYIYPATRATVRPRFHTQFLFLQYSGVR